MKSKKKNEMEKAQNTKGAAQELDMDALEDVSGGCLHLSPYLSRARSSGPLYEPPCIDRDKEWRGGDRAQER